MKPILHIHIGKAKFTSRPIEKSGLESGIKDLLLRLGLDIEVAMDYTANERFLIVEDEICYFPETTVEQVEQYVSTFSLDDHVYWYHLIQAILWLQPRVLIFDDLTHHLLPVLTALPADKQEDKPLQGKRILCELLDLKLSFADTSWLNSHVDQYLDDAPIPWGVLREDLIEKLSVRTILLYIHPDYFKQVLSAMR